MSLFCRSRYLGMLLAKKYEVCARSMGRSTYVALTNLQHRSYRTEHVDLVNTEPWSHLGLNRKPKIAVGMSGGVDSSIAAYLLKRKGCEVFGVFMKTWDSLEEGEDDCNMEQDLLDAQRACEHLSIPLQVVDFVPQYWQNVFNPFIEEFTTGLTPNPDLSCNKHVKFGELIRHVKEAGADALATGHYAQIRASQDNEMVQLLRGVDKEKDQSYFLSRVGQEGLRNAIFPLGQLEKGQVRKLAVDIGLPNAAKRSSAGICFIGRRKFPRFIKEYVSPSRGDFVSVGGGIVGEHDGVELYTRGQRAKIGGAEQPWYVVGKDIPNRIIYVAEGEHHPSLYSEGAILKEMHWLSSEPESLQKENILHCTFKARYLQHDVKCTINGIVDGCHPEHSSFYTFNDLTVPQKLWNASFENPVRAITPQQGFVLYSGEICLGSALVHFPSLTCYEKG